MPVDVLDYLFGPPFSRLPPTLQRTSRHAAITAPYAPSEGLAIGTTITPVKTLCDLMKRGDSGKSSGPMICIGHLKSPNIRDTVGRNLVDIPNVLSGFRLIAAPFLLYLARTGHPRLFLALLAVSLFSDSIDGFIARRLNKTSEFGTKLDSWGDLATYLTVPLCAWWLWPEILKREAFFVVLVVSAYVLPLVAGFVKFRRLPSYHTWAAKAAAVLMSIAFFILFIFDISRPFHCAAILQALVACEEIAMTLMLPEWHGNVPSFLHATRLAGKHAVGKNKAV